jgi:hypothetical protein
MNTFTQNIVEGKMDKLNTELETSLRMSGEVIESLTLGLGDTTIEREVLPDGSRGEITISTQENDSISGHSVTYRKYVIAEGELVHDTRFGERTVGKYRKVTVLAKIAFGRVNHWDLKSDFYGTAIEYDGE